MGRRPNPLVGEFFERGQKLSDASNRYQHTCRRCGELFPKGRVDSLVTHLLRRCPNLSHEDREWVFHQQYQSHDAQKTDTPDKRPSKRPRNDLSQPVLQNEIPLQFGQSNHQQDEREHERLQEQYQQQQQQSQSALDTLAEVSRRHLDYSTRRLPDRDRQEQQQKTLGEILAEAALIHELQRATGLDNPSGAADLPVLYLNSTNATEAGHTQDSSNELFAATTYLSKPGLVQTASAANQQLEHSQSQNALLDQNGPVVDPQLHEMAMQVQVHSDVQSGDQNQGHATDPLSWKQLDVNVPPQALGGSPVQSTEQSNPGFGILQRPTKGKTRGRFNDVRRKEVQEIRKRGACMRCRMLKKPCSEGTPCNTCSTVESARLWKGTCLRTRLSDECSLWSANLLHSRAKIEVPAAVVGLEHAPLPGRIEARFFRSSNICMSFSGKSYSGTRDVDPSLKDAARDNESEPTNIQLLDEGESMSDKIEEYVNSIANSHVESESSPFIQASLKQALVLVQSEEAEQVAKAAESREQQTPRSCYTLQTQLLKNVVELWIETELLTSPELYELELRHEPTQIPRQLPSLVQWDADNGSASSTPISLSSESHRLILAQLLAATESRCNKLSKAIMNELERRLLQRQQVSRFATFLSAVILLSCVERMAGFYKTRDKGGHESSMQPEEPCELSKPSDGQTSRDDASNKPLIRSNSWPLDQPPSHFWPQGEHFADLLVMLLRIRALPPNVLKNADGTLAAIQNYALPVQVNGRPVKQPIDDQVKLAADWLDPLRLPIDTLVKKRDGARPGGDEGLEAWSLRFVSKALLPEWIA